jgi:hypothetical protein
MKLKSLTELKGAELFNFIKENKLALISEKKSMPVKFAEPISYTPEFFSIKEGLANKALIKDIPLSATSLRVKVVANACWFLDSQFDVLFNKAYKRSRI